MSVSWLVSLLFVYSLCVISDCLNGPPIEIQSDAIFKADSLDSKCSALPVSKLVEGCSSVTDTCSSHSEEYADTFIDSVYSSIKEAGQKLANPSDYPPHYNPSNGETFDFIVVGAGSAGAVVANRLTEVKGWNVLLIEAGGNPTKTSEIPALTGALRSTKIDWQYKTDPDEDNCLGMVNRSCNWPRGKVLGGSHTINLMVYVRGNSRDYDGWASAGNTGWSFEDVLPYFKKSEDMRAPEVLATEEANKYHGKGGNLKVESWPASGVDSLMDAYGKGLEELGYPWNPDCNGKNQTGFTRAQGTVDYGRRFSTAKAFLSPIKDRKNLKVAKYSMVTKILIDAKNLKANGVELTDKKGNTLRVMSTKEVIVSAGSINSPQLLMLSGIGPKEHLSSFGIPVISNLAVGENLQDHPLMGSLAMTVNTSVSTGSRVENMFDFLIKGSGPLSTIGSLRFVGFINLGKEVDYPDVELLHVFVPKNDSDAMTQLMTASGYTENIIKKFVEINENGDTVVFRNSLLRPFSRGRVLLRSLDPNTHPKIVSGNFLDRRDIDTFLKVFDFIYRLMETQALKSMDAKLHEVRLDGCEVHPLRSPEYRECSLRHLTATTYHHSGSCRMGPSWDPTAVVDPALRVVGVQGLRVVDASVMPTIISGNINAAVIMIAEKASDLIKETWK